MIWWEIVLKAFLKPCMQVKDSVVKWQKGEGKDTDDENYIAVVQNKPKRPNKIFQTTALFPMNWRKGIAFNLKKLKSPSLEDTLCYGFGSLKM